MRAGCGETPYRHASATIPPLVRGVSNCAQHLRDGTVSVRRGQSAIVPSSAEARDCRSPWLASPLFANTQPKCSHSSLPQGSAKEVGASEDSGYVVTFSLPPTVAIPRGAQMHDCLVMEIQASQSF